MSPAAVVVTGLGVVTGAGAGRECLRAALEAGRDLARPIPRWDTDGLRVGRAVLCDDPGDAAPGLGRSDRLASVALAEAVAGLPEADRQHAALFLGVGASSLYEAEARYLAAPADRRGPADAATFVERPPGASAEGLARDAGLLGPVRTVATACASSSNAIGAAFRAVRSGRVPAAVAGGVEVIGWLTLVGFHALNVLTADALRPFDARRSGIVLGEGAGFLLLERRERARARGAPVLGAVLGYASGAEGWHPTQPDPTGAPAARVMRLALEDAGIRPSAVAWVKSHGNGTRPSDLAEARAIRAVMGAHRVPVTSMKGVLGHTLAASGAVETVATLDALSLGRLPPTWGLDEPDAECDVDLHRPGEPPRAASGPVVVNAFAFGGNDATLVVEGPR